MVGLLTKEMTKDNNITIGDIISPLAPNVTLYKGDKSQIISGITLNSLDTKPGNLFIAIKGTRLDGLNFSEDALKRGAIALALDSDRIDGVIDKDKWQAIIGLDDPRWATGIMASAFYGWPSRKMSLIGITGTNGKTTTTYLLESIFRVARLKTGVIGTIRHKILDKEISATQTTPDPITLQRLLSSMLEEGVEVVCMECSSHALIQDRVSGCRFKGAIFTNLSQDHLDYHKDMKSYFDAKLRLFTIYSPSFSVINIDDSWGRRLFNIVLGQKISYGFSPQAMVRPLKCSQDIEGIRARLITPKGLVDITSRLIGKHNLYNIMAAVATCISLGIDLRAIAFGIAACSNISGRLERVNSSSGILAFVDYAHTPDALFKVLSSLKEITKKRLIVVVGCGGDRDRSKRPIMAQVVSKLSDISILTSDNPRSEYPDKIIKDMLAGLNEEQLKDVVVIPDRKEAIFEAVKRAKKSDVILVAGKGHETYQIIGDKKIDFDDRKVLKEAFREVFGE